MGGFLPSCPLCSMRLCSVIASISIASASSGSVWAGMARETWPCIHQIDWRVKHQSVVVVTLSMRVRSNLSLNAKSFGEEAPLDKLMFSARVHHGDLDDIIPLRASEQMVEALEMAGADVKLTQYPKMLHDSWSAAHGNLEVYQWMFSCVRTVKGDDVVVPAANKSIVVE